MGDCRRSADAAGRMWSACGGYGQRRREKNIRRRAGVRLAGPLFCGYARTRPGKNSGATAKSKRSDPDAAVAARALAGRPGNDRAERGGARTARGADAVHELMAFDLGLGSRLSIKVL